MMAFGTMALFGVAYIVSSGAFLLWGIALWQTARAPLFGTVWDAAGSGTACFPLP
jgi:hypothetical protein